MLANITPVTNLVESGPLTWDMAKQIIQSQHNLAIYSITALVGVTAGLLIITWVWNLFLRKHELNKAIESLKAEMTAKEKEAFAELAKETKDEIGEIKEEIEKTVSERMILFDAEKASLFALANSQAGHWDVAATWWAIAIEGYARSNLANMVRISVNALNASLTQCQKLGNKGKKTIEGHLSSIPPILSQEKEQIEDKLSKLPEEIPKESVT